ncbi:SDR family NAD(P)-dependent oxidoreductase [Patulibacter sp. NPDC049589]|uniref:SDR family NAD(P)-dependent oxidoreductase n=1 Tax=Patulibacter sp. NPDC049589 TaxID=3154731 RepID=UPI00343FA023
MSGELEGRVALVTGAGRGIGAAVAAALEREGATVVRTDIAGTDVVLDVRDEAAVARVVAETAEQHGRLDIVVPNAGVAFVKPLTETSLAEWRELMAINLDGVFVTAREAAKVMAQAGKGSIVNIASVTGLRSAPLIGAYGASKHGVVGLTKTLGAELRDFGVRVNCVCPGFAGTDMVSSHEQELTDAIGMPVQDVINARQGRLGTAEEIADTVLFLASDRASFCTSGAYVMDGGLYGALV